MCVCVRACVCVCVRVYNKLAFSLSCRRTMLCLCCDVCMGQVEERACVLVICRRSFCLVRESYGTHYQSGSRFLIKVGSGISLSAWFFLSIFFCRTLFPGTANRESKEEVALINPFLFILFCRTLFSRTANRESKEEVALNDPTHQQQRVG